MSTISEALKKSRQVHLLVELDFGGLVKRYAMRDLVVPYSAGDDRFFEAAILREFEVGTSFGLQTMSYAQQVVRLEIANKGRLHDQEALRKLDGGIGSVYVWCEGLDWADIETNGLIFKGIFEKQYHTRNIYSFVLRDPADSKFTILPETTISTDTWSGARTEGGGGSVIGSPQQMVYGDWSKGIPLKCVDTSGYKYLAHVGKSKALHAHYSAGTLNVYDKDGSVIAAANYTFYPSGMDSEGNVVAYFDFTSDQAANEPLSCSIYGVYDGSGDYTGAANTLIEHPGDIVLHLLNNYSTLNPDEIHKESLKTMKTLIPGVKFASLINATANGKDIVDRILKQCLVARLTRAGKIGVMTLASNIGESAKIRWDHHLVGAGERISSTPADLIQNKIRARYGINPSTGQYEGELTMDRTNNDTCNRSYLDYGESPEIQVDLSDVHEEDSARQIVRRMIDLRAFRHDIIDIEVPYSQGIDIREGDAALLSLRDGSSASGSGWTDEKCILLERHFTRNTISQRWWRVNA